MSEPRDWFKSMLVKGFPMAISDACVSSTCDGMKGMASESRVSVGCEERIEIAEEKSCCLTLIESKVLQNGGKKERVNSSFMREVIG